MPIRFRSFISICLVAGVVALLALPVSAAPSDPTRLGFCGGDDWEPDVAADGAGHVYVVWAHFAGAGGCTPSDTGHNRRTFIQVSDDGGKTWGDPHLVADTVNGVDYPAQIDTTVTVSDTGAVYVGFLAYGLHGSELDTIVAKSTDFGETFPVVRKVNGPACVSTDHPFGVAHGDDVYFAYTKGKTHCLAVSTNGGDSWTETNIGVFDTVGFNEGGVIDPKGNAWFAWTDCESSHCTGSPAGDYRVSKTFAGTSTTTFSPVLATTPQGPDCPYSTCGFAYFGPQNDVGIDAAGRLYMLYQNGQTDQRKSPPVIDLLRCSSHCLSASGWRFASRVDDKTATGCPDASCYALFPRVTGFGARHVGVMWMDDRNDGLDGTVDHVDGWNVWYRTSTNKGTSWTGSGQKISAYDPSQAQSTPDGFRFPYGDYEDLVPACDTAPAFAWAEGFNWIGGPSAPGHVEYASRC